MLSVREPKTSVGISEDQLQANRPINKGLGEGEYTN